MFYDTHCHLALCSQPVGPDDLNANIRYFDNTVTPRAFADDASVDTPQVVRGLGLHPWYNGDLDEFRALAPEAHFFGEIGMDFSKHASLSPEEQAARFRELAEICKQYPGRILSIHAVDATGEVLRILEETGALEENRCIFHWFSGSSGELFLARSSGCYFSANRRMIESKRGRSYIAQIPLGQLLLETDLPSETETLYDADSHEQELEEMLTVIATIRGMARDELAAAIEETSRALWEAAAS